METVAHGLRSSATVGPPFGDVSPEEPGSSDGEDEEEIAPGAQARHPSPALTQEERSAPAGGGSAAVEPLPERPASPILQAGQESGEDSEALPPPLLVDEGGEESVSAPDIFGDLAEKQ